MASTIRTSGLQVAGAEVSLIGWLSRRALNAPRVEDTREQTASVSGVIP
ncbi:MAG: hypothetical protein IPF97_15430 [Sphingomonadales bacterium]|nr:hypothetical protein [Sphingomonadales bacterium]MBK6720093.1 hypothetical protein [Sphingomonadales bacterium]MBL0001767.1 hypothetical protein [Sphingomonadales bacterium]